jgi:hypothetical protein
LTFQPSGTTQVSFVVSMLATVNFKNETPFERYKVNDVWSDWRLPLDLDSVEPVRAQQIPEPPLRVGHAGAKSFGLPT